MTSTEGNSPLLLSIDNDELHGHYLAKVSVLGDICTFQVIVHDEKTVLVASGDELLYTTFSEDIDCYTNVLAAVRLTHLQHQLNFPINLHSPMFH